jgi:acetyl-CoA carboxylase carboxyltransferase component
VDLHHPRDTRRVLVQSLAMLASKKEKLPQRKHGNVPL